MSGNSNELGSFDLGLPDFSQPESNPTEKNVGNSLGDSMMAEAVPAGVGPHVHRHDQHQEADRDCRSTSAEFNSRSDRTCCRRIAQGSRSQHTLEYRSKLANQHGSARGSPVGFGCLEH